MRSWRKLFTVARLLTLLAMALGSAAITVGSVAYFDAEELPAFVVEKLPLPLEEVWMWALRLHVLAAALALPACLLLLSTTLLRRAPRVHRWLGRVTGATVLLVLAPSGFYLSLFAKGGLPATLGFVLSGVIVVVSMVQGIRTARAGKFAEHRRHALHVLAQLSVAVTSRAMLFAFDAVGAEANFAYLVSLWLPVVASALVVELLAPRTNLPFTPRRKHETQTDLRPAHARQPRLSHATSG